MPTSAPGSAFSKNRWLLPVILVVVIAVIVLGAIFGSRLKNLASGPTATPVPTSPPATVIVTATPARATPGSVTPTPSGGAAIPPTATPSTRGAATPLPSETPPPTVVGLLTGMVIHKQADVAAIQAAVNVGKSQYQYYLNPVQVVQNTLPQYGFTQGFQILSPSASPTPTPTTGADGRPLVVVMVRYQGATYIISVVQPATRGRKGIWLIVTILPQS